MWGSVVFVAPWEFRLRRSATTLGNRHMQLVRQHHGKSCIQLVFWERTEREKRRNSMRVDESGKRPGVSFWLIVPSEIADA